ncbi:MULTISPECIES: DUF4431 domain-containing protein [unclassified Duganella]|uniref:DUF4431 domain-containing protein n=1 Tax=unclassified Duganella TaxID=2636909 RepID=UPI000E34A077|nr:MULTISPECIES: DUF4431 domain-containing protein [unclassified Duganella]RFP14564.1 DUF4431 domain-containing protein [Duganella sp. BJB475]RFP30912.1 DUF4431 domain-containing protein [Duganella sp. BJB476]
MTRAAIALAWLLAVQAAPACAAPVQCLKYGVDTTVVAGKLHRATFPGRPNYESVADGDEPETGYYLSLDPAICTVSGAGSNETDFASVREIQLVLNAAQYAELKPRLGTVVRLRGKLFSAFTGHHHADVLLQVAK